MYQVIFTPNSEKQLKKLPKDIQVRIINALKRIRIRPESYLTKLVDDPAYKFRVGDYRLIIDVIHDKLILLVVKIGHRRNVYQ
ncbi:MAG: type II toxin-antitoxin system RelE/ParE family toxin [Candidatus Woesearchaeota archaeon]|jgi:mRNA interferase RelE/StbE|nr:type II toxin-antitoxin system RelE/ParE family toxin [Candidatus Woesearchaeota archaeon]MDP7506767.1 type II toxin-antitoxin system RelE/ParE family toxin [Candidatus Woesearchaeota archaeon]|tara:strand:- start:780 stop:1028 length:249 start_codon:yes stop_codon:yes gene_type:complete